MRGLWNDIVFAVGETESSWRDVALAGVLTGAWQEVFDRALVGQHLLRSAEDADEAPVASEEVESAANDFRYARDLVTADEMSTWLERWGLDTDTWMTWVTADLLRARADSDEVPPSEGIPPEEREAAVFAEAVCSNALGRMAYHLAERCAVAAKLTEDGTEPTPAADDASLPGEAGLLADVERLDLGLSPEEARRCLKELAALERGYLAFREAIGRPDDVAARARARQADWMRIHARILQLPAEDVAREALFSIQEDGTAMDEVAADAGGELREGTWFMEDLDPALRDHLLAARKGEVVGPLQNGAGWALAVVEEKILASVDDEEIRARALESLLESTIGREVDNRVSWRWGK